MEAPVYTIIKIIKLLDLSIKSHVVNNLRQCYIKHVQKAKHSGRTSAVFSNPVNLNLVSSGRCIFSSTHTGRVARQVATHSSFSTNRLNVLEWFMITAEPATQAANSCPVKAAGNI